jgi:hypothetical protein
MGTELFVIQESIKSKRYWSFNGYFTNDINLVAFYKSYETAKYMSDGEEIVLNIENALHVFFEKYTGKQQ